MYMCPTVCVQSFAESDETYYGDPVHCIWSLSSEVHVHRRVNLQCVYVIHDMVCTVYRPLVGGCVLCPWIYRCLIPHTEDA